jgi:hypothetical protein
MTQDPYHTSKDAPAVTNNVFWSSNNRVYVRDKQHREFFCGGRLLACDVPDKLGEPVNHN